MADQIVITDPLTDEGLVVTRELVEQVVRDKQVSVSFKDEDEVRGVTVGPVYIWDLAEDGTKFVPVGEPVEPAGQLMNLGWLTKPDALRIAEWAGVDLESS